MLSWPNLIYELHFFIMTLKMKIKRPPIRQTN